MIYRILGVVLAAIMLAGITAAQDAVDPSTLELSGTPQDICAAATPAVEPENRTYPAPEQVLEDGVDYRAIMCTSAGAIYIDLLEEYAPVTVNNFVFLAENNYYNNTIFHRVIEDFMAQGGDPTGTGTGGPGYQFQDEIVGFLRFDRNGQLAMANAGPGTNGSQFFITTSEPQHLNGRHTIFGEVLQGYDNVEAITIRDPQNASAPATDLNAVVIVDDPAQVETTYEPAAADTTAGDIIAALETIRDTPDLPQDLLDGLTISDEITTDDVINSAPDDAQDTYETLLAENNHQYRVTATMENTSCSGEYFFENLTYTVDVFDDAAAAEAVLTSDSLVDVAAASGFEQVSGDDTDTYYTRTVESCAGGDAQQVQVYITRERYLVTVSAILPAAIIAQIEESPEITIPVLLSSNVTSIFEVPLADIYRAAIN